MKDIGELYLHGMLWTIICVVICTIITCFVIRGYSAWWYLFLAIPYGMICKVEGTGIYS